VAFSLEFHCSLADLTAAVSRGFGGSVTIGRGNTTANTFPALDSAQVLPNQKLKFEAFPGKIGSEVKGFTNAAK